MTHRGEIVEKVVRNNGYSISKLAKKLNISRNTLYNRFANPELGYTFIMQVGRAIYYDFTIDFPEIKHETDLITENPMLVLRKDEATVLWNVNRKYIQLLEEYTKLLNILVKIANQSEGRQLKNDLTELIERGV